MDKKVLLITEKNISFLLRSVQEGLTEHGLEVVTVPADINQLSKMEDLPPVVLIHAGQFSDQNHDILVYIRDLCTEKERKVVLLGYDADIESVKRTISSSLLCGQFARPLDVKQIAETLSVELEKCTQNADKKHILVVDDSGMMLRTIRSWLADYFKVSVSNSAANAFTFLNTAKPDLILLDYEMPVCSGPQFLEMIRGEISTSDIPVIFLTSKGDKESVQKVLALKPEGYLLKTTPPEKVVETINNYFERKKLEKVQL